MQTYDSLSPFEKMLLKCGAVLGEIFSRRMLHHLLQNDSQIKIAKGVYNTIDIDKTYNIYRVEASDEQSAMCFCARHV